MDTVEERKVLPFVPKAGRRPTAETYRMVVSKAAAESAEIWVYDFIGAGWMGGISADQFRKDLQTLGSVKNIDLHINSDGGDVFDAKAMYSLLVAHPAKVTVHIDGLAASAASFLAMAGDEIRMAEGAFMMIHNAWGVAIGSAVDMRQTADLLDSVTVSIADTYASRSGLSIDKIKGMMDAETWMNGKETVDNNFADILVESKKVAACVREPSRFKNLPLKLQPNRIALQDRISAALRSK